MPQAEIERVRAALASVEDPVTGRDIVSLGWVRGLVARDGKVGFVIEAPQRDPSGLEPIRAAAEQAARAVPGVASVTAVLTAETPAGAPPKEPPPAPGVTRVRKGQPSAPPPARAEAAPQRLELPGVSRIIAVASGKGGVGKSTIAVNLACALAKRGLAAGLLDADIYGPSAPIMTGLQDGAPETGKHGKLEPLRAHGVKVMSIGFVVDTDAPMIWRGPIVTSALMQMLNDVAWAPLDVLVVDMPPGTGDVQLTLAQRAPLSGAVIVSTPQKVALADVRRGVEMFRRTHVPILGVIENMSGLGGAPSAFGAGGARDAAAALDAPFLGALPLDPALTAMSDEGRPPAACAPDSAIAHQFDAIAQQIAAALETDPRRPAPKIAFS